MANLLYGEQSTVPRNLITSPSWIAVGAIPKRQLNFQSPKETDSISQLVWTLIGDREHLALKSTNGRARSFPGSNN